MALQQAEEVLHLGSMRVAYRYIDKPIFLYIYIKEARKIKQLGCELLISVPCLRTSVLRSRWILYMSSVAILRACVCGDACMNIYENKKEHIICYVKEKNYYVPHFW